MFTELFFAPPLLLFLPFPLNPHLAYSGHQATGVVRIASHTGNENVQSGLEGKKAWRLYIQLAPTDINTLGGNEASGNPIIPAEMIIVAHLLGVPKRIAQEVKGA